MQLQYDLNEIQELLLNDLDMLDPLSLESFRRQLSELQASYDDRLFTYFENRFLELFSFVASHFVYERKQFTALESRLLIGKDDAEAVLDYFLNQYLHCLPAAHGHLPKELYDRSVKRCIKTKTESFQKLTEYQRGLVLIYIPYAKEVIDQFKTEQYQLEAIKEEVANDMVQLRKELDDYLVRQSKDSLLKNDPVPTQGMSGFNFPNHSKPSALPFSFCGYADTHSPWFGVAFRINKDCFDGRDPLLYYADDDLIGNKPENLQKFIDNIALYSSGLKEVKVVTKVVYGKDLPSSCLHKFTFIPTIRFRLDPAKIKKTISVDGGKIIHTADLGGYFLVIPKVGEFDIELGEIINGKRVPLHRNGFCMK